MKKRIAVIFGGQSSEHEVSCMSAVNVIGGLNREKYEAYRTHVPAAFEELVIDGGCHAFFGDYGPQKGDGEPMISRELQMGITASAVSAWIDTL